MEQGDNFNNTLGTNRKSTVQETVYHTKDLVSCTKFAGDKDTGGR